MRRMETSGNKTGRGRLLGHLVTFSCILVTSHSSLEKYERLFFFFFFLLLFFIQQSYGNRKGKE